MDKILAAFCIPICVLFVCGVVDGVRNTPCPPELLPIVWQFINETADALMAPECEKLREKLLELRKLKAQQAQAEDPLPMEEAA